MIFLITHIQHGATSFILGSAITYKQTERNTMLIKKTKKMKYLGTDILKMYRICMLMNKLLIKETYEIWKDFFFCFHGLQVSA